MSAMIVSSLFECLATGVTKIRCKSLNFRFKDMSHDLNDAGTHAHPKDYGPKAVFIYKDVSESPKICLFNIFPILKWTPNAKSYSAMTYFCLSLSILKNEYVKIKMKIWRLTKKKKKKKR